MTDKELKRNLKKFAIGFVIIILCIIGLLIYTLGGQKAELSIYANAGYLDNLQALGIDEDEFKEYLSVFGNLADTDYDENQRMLNMATNFMENLYSTELQIDENGIKTYDANDINNIIKEVQGTFIKTSLDGGEFYRYHPEENTYIQTQDTNRIMNCTEINEIEKKGDKLEVTYSLKMINKDQLAEYMTGQTSNFETHRIKASIMINTDYEYSKYFVSEIEKI